MVTASGWDLRSRRCAWREGLAVAVAALVGAGALAEALVGGLLGSGVAAADLAITNRSDVDRLQRFAARGLRTTRDPGELAAAADLLVLLVKPRDAAAALEALRPHLGSGHRVLSCLAGVPTAFIERVLGGRARVLRAMPNIGSAVRASATALAAGRHALPDDVAAAAALLGAVGTVEQVPEEMLDAVTAVAGSGPAYVYLLMEGLAEAAAAAGLPAETAGRLILQTVEGAARLAAASGRPPAELRREVSSPGGTTVAALGVLEGAGFRAALVSAVAAAAARSRELGRQWGG